MGATLAPTTQTEEGMSYSAVKGREDESLIGVPGLSNFLVVEGGLRLLDGGTWGRAGSRGVENNNEPVEVVDCSLPGRSTGDETFGLEIGETEGAMENGVEAAEDKSS
jgi:hypothetical protein